MVSIGMRENGVCFVDGRRRSRLKLETKKEMRDNQQMGYDLTLREFWKCPKCECIVEDAVKREREYNISYNYTKYFNAVFPGIGLQGGLHFLRGKTGLESISILEEAIRKTSMDKKADFARNQLEEMLKMAREIPNGVWEILG